MFFDQICADDHKAICFEHVCQFTFETFTQFICVFGGRFSEGAFFSGGHQGTAHAINEEFFKVVECFNGLAGGNNGFHRICLTLE
ncbi:hypothetical protein SDC9_191479 [bioreactor metagenome]|uniref:Uncharacterized protein n=1 Tax=bioreactor metagenome TaxID=1076179 RepID=A0A645HY36_9ZZZZ